MTSRRVRVLLIEDSPLDAELIQRVLRSDGLDCDFTIATCSRDLEQQLARSFDVVVADYALPDLDVPAALKETRRVHPDVPFVVVSGSTTEEQLLSALRLGATDYLMKDRLARLPSAVRAAIEAKELRLSQARSELLLRRQEDELRHLQRVESIGRLAGGIAHDLNNLNTVVLGNLEIALQLLEPDAPAREPLAEVVEALARARSLSRQMLAFARREPMPAAALDPDEIVRSVLALARPSLPGRIDVTARLATAGARIRGDRVQFEQVLLNLLLNAVDAMPHGGALNVATERAAPDPVGDAWRAHPRGSHVVIRVADSGIGIPPELHERVFEPFFTTKPAEIGTGLGLSTARAIVEQAQGSIQLRSEPGRGSEFLVALPAAEP